MQFLLYKTSSQIMWFAAFDRSNVGGIIRRFTLFIRRNLHQSHFEIPCISIRIIPIFYVTGPYGTEGIEQFKFLLENTSVCIAQHKIVAENSTEETYKAIFDIFRYGNERYNARAKIIVCFCEGEVIKRVFEAIKRIKAAGEFIVLGRYRGAGSKLVQNCNIMFIVYKTENSLI